MKNRKTTLVAGLALTLLGAADAGAQSSFAGNAQHTATYNATAQNLNAVHWTTAIDLNNTGGFAHYGAPILTPANTIFVPVKTGATSGFRINALNGASGATLYSLSTDYISPSSQWIGPYQPVLATNSIETRLYYPGAGGTVYYINKADSASHGAPVQQAFYTTLAGYQANTSGFNSTIFIDTPITADSSGNIFFGFRVQGTAPAPLNSAQSGYARIDPNGNGTYVLAGTAAGDVNISFDSHNAGPAVSNDQSTVYVVVKSANADSSYGYLLGLDATSLATKYKAFLRDPRSNNANPATLLDISTASPMVGPDNDVYFGIYGNPANGSRGFLLHFSGDLTVEKAPGGFGWDYTPGVVPASMVPSYTGPSTYLLAAKYNNYANAGGDSGDAVNRIAVLDPNSTEVDAHASSNGMLIMREVLTVIGPTPDPQDRSASVPYAVREWCINSPAVDPATNSIFFPSEDGNIYRWNLATNSLDQFVRVSVGIGEPYVPTVIGPDGTVFSLNGGTLSAVGSLKGVGIALTSSVPDVRTGVPGQSITFSMAVTNPGNSGIVPTGTVTLRDSTTTLAANLTLDGNGNASYTTVALSVDKHFITASYSGDANFSAGNASLVQFVHASASSTTLTSSVNPSTPGQQVTFTAKVAGTATGQVTFVDGTTVIGQVPLNANGVATLSTASLAQGSHTITATYASDTNFAASSGSVVQSLVTATSTTATSAPNPSVFGQPVTFTSTTTSGAGVPAGTVTFKEGTTVRASNVPVNGAGQASFTTAASTAALSTGSHTITATFTGASGWGNSSGNAPSQTVNKAATTTGLTSAPNPSSPGQSVTFTATVAAVAPGAGVPTGTVKFLNGSTVLTTGTLNGSGVASFSISTLAAGSTTITATYSSDTNFSASSGSRIQTVQTGKATTTTVRAVPNPSVFGQSVTYTSTTTSSGGAPAGTVTFTEGATVWASNLPVNGAGQASFNTAALTTGGHTLTATFTGASGWSNSAGTAAAQTVHTAATTIVLSSSANPSVYGQLVTFSALVAAKAPGAGLPTGTVTFKKGGTSIGTGTLNGSGTATITFTTPDATNHSITADYSGDGNFNASTSATYVQMGVRASSTNTVTSSLNPSTSGQAVTFTSTLVANAPGAGIPAGTVTFSDGTRLLGTATLNAAGTAVLTTSTLASGIHQISAVYKGNLDFLETPSPVLVQTVN